MGKFIPEVGDVITMSTSKQTRDRSYTSEEWKVINRNEVSLFLRCEKDRGILPRDIIIEIDDRYFAIAWPAKQEEKPKRVRVYIKEDAEMHNRASSNETGWSDVHQGSMIGKVLDVRDKFNDGDLKVWMDDEHTDWWPLAIGSVVIVEGSLEDLK